MSVTSLVRKHFPKLLGKGYSNFYITFNDAPGGVFKSQVCDVVEYLNAVHSADMQLVSFISLRGFFRNRRCIHKFSSDALVLPMFPKIENWKLAIYLLLIFIPKNTAFVLCRGPFATSLAMELRRKKRCKKVGFDARGAYWHEWTEYDLALRNDKLGEVVKIIEKNCVRNSDFNLAVSNSLVAHWQNEFGYSSSKHVVIPCTLGMQQHIHPEFCENTTRHRLGLKEEDVCLAYSGSIAGWQSFNLLENYIGSCLDNNVNLKVLFLSKQNKNIENLQSKFPGRVLVEWVAVEEVPGYLSICDYGILLREETVTNQVAAPTKFAEYLSNGLRVIISSNLGDYSDFVREHSCGVVVTQVSEKHDFTFGRVAGKEKERIKALSEKYFRKESFDRNYEEILKKLRSK